MIPTFKNFPTVDDNVMREQLIPNYSKLLYELRGERELQECGTPTPQQ